MIEESKNFISKYIKSFTASRYRSSAIDNEVLNNIFPKISINQDDLTFLNSRNKILFEIGTGWGDFIINYAINNRDFLCIGSDPYKGGLIQTCHKININNIENIKLFHGDGRILIDLFPDDKIDIVTILFPDPWPKKKHNIRRVVQYSYIIHLLTKIKRNGIIVCATDDGEYQAHMRDIFTKLPNYEILNYEDFLQKYHFYTKTKYHKKAELSKRDVVFFIVKKI